MNILNTIKDQIALIKKRTNKIDLSDLLVHLERAEYFFNEAKTTQDDNFYTDVVYRTNQAFEGALREAYVVLSKKRAEKIRTVDIENYFQTSSILHERVIQFFTVYRQNWRNESAHNYRLFFNESEAMLAITTVSSFAYILIDQILEALAFEVEKTKKLNIKELSSIVKSDAADLEDKLISLIKIFISKNTDILMDGNYKEIEFIGAFHGFLSMIENQTLNIEREPKIQLNGQILRPDLIVQSQNEKAIIEFKRRSKGKPNDLDRTQLIKYLMLTEIEIGIIFYYNPNTSEEIQIEKHILDDYDKTFKIIEVY